MVQAAKAMTVDEIFWGAARIRSNAMRPGGLGDSISIAGRRGTNVRS